MAVAFDAVGPSSAGQGHNGSPTGPGVVESWTHTCTGSNLVLIVGIAIGIQSANNDSTVTLSATYNSVSMTDCGVGRLHSDGGTSGLIQVFYLVAPATGANTVAVSQSGWVQNIAAGEFTSSGGSMSFTGVDQATPLRNVDGATGNGASATNAVTGGSTNEMVFSFEGGGSSLTTHNQTTRFVKNVNTDSACGNSGGATAAGSASTVTMTRTLGADGWACIAGALQPAGAGPTNPVAYQLIRPQAVRRAAGW